MKLMHNCNVYTKDMDSNEEHSLISRIAMGDRDAFSIEFEASSKQGISLEAVEALLIKGKRELLNIQLEVKQA